MLKTYTYPKYEYTRPPELSGAAPRRYSVIIVVAGPVGLTAPLDCQINGTDAIVLDDEWTNGSGRR